MEHITLNARLETGMLIKIHEADRTVPLFALSEKTSEQIFELQAICERNLPAILQDGLVWRVLERYIPDVLIEIVGREAIVQKLNTPNLMPYRNAILTKKLSCMAFYKFGDKWEDFKEKLNLGFMAGIKSVIEEAAT
jgi:glutamate dehydrogenase